MTLELICHRFVIQTWLKVTIDRWKFNFLAARDTGLFQSVSCLVEGIFHATGSVSRHEKVKISLPCKKHAPEDRPLDSKQWLHICWVIPHRRQWNCWRCRGPFHAPVFRKKHETWESHGLSHLGSIHTRHRSEFAHNSVWIIEKVCVQYEHSCPV